MWERLAEIYGHRFTSAYGFDSQAAAGITWQQGLRDLSAQQIATGLSACMASGEQWPPALPEFRAMCLGIPPLAVVTEQLLAGQAAASGFTRAVWSRIDGWRFKQADAKQAAQLIRDAYEGAREHVMRGGAVPDPATAAIARETAAPAPFRRADPEVARQHLDAMRRVLGVGADQA